MNELAIRQLRAQAEAFSKAGRLGDSIRAYQHLLQAAPRRADDWYNYAVALRRANLDTEALKAYDQALALNIEGAEDVHVNKAVILLEAFRNSQACETELNKALALKPGHMPALKNLASLREDQGRQDDARTLYEDMLEQCSEDVDALSRLAALHKPNTKDDPIILRVRDAMARPGLNELDRSILGFALGRLMDACRAFPEAFNAYRDANETTRRTSQLPPYSPQSDLTIFQKSREAFAEPGKPGIPAANEPEVRPVFILGLFRSGSTLAEQVLASHSKVASGGEMEMIPQIAMALGGTPAAIAAASPEALTPFRAHLLRRLQAIGPTASLVTDKRPENFWHIGLIKRLFPEAKIIHTRRHPLDNCLSMYFQQLAPTLSFASDLVGCGHHLIAEREMMAHWKKLWPDDILTHDYEDMIADQRGMTERLLDFLDLPFEDACLEFHKADSIVRTASVWQVRQPVHTSSKARWRHYDAYLDELKTLLAQSNVSSELD